MRREVNSSQRSSPPSSTAGDTRLYLRDEELDRGVGLILAGERILTAASEMVRQQAGLSRTELQALLAIAYLPGQTVGDVRKHVSATVPTFARCLAAIEGKDLIEKATPGTDRRQRTLTLSATGETVMAPIINALRDTMRDAYREAGAERVMSARILLEALSR